jgi:hypothetical protein
MGEYSDFFSVIRETLKRIRRDLNEARDAKSSSEQNIYLTQALGKLHELKSFHEDSRLTALVNLAAYCPFGRKTFIRWSIARINEVLDEA